MLTSIIIDRVGNTNVFNIVQESGVGNPALKPTERLQSIIDDDLKMCIRDRIWYVVESRKPSWIRSSGARYCICAGFGVQCAAVANAIAASRYCIHFRGGKALMRHNPAWSPVRAASRNCRTGCGQPERLFA